MKLTDIWNSTDKPTISFELFPARSEKAADNLNYTIDSLATLEPDFVSVTFGAGGSTREGSLALLEKLKLERKLEVVAYFACYGLAPNEIISVLDSYKSMGIDNVLAVRGDKPRDTDFEPHPESLPHASDLIAFIREHYDFCIGAAGYPEGHKEAASRQTDLDYLKLKVDQGAEYIIANYFYDNRYYFDFLEQCRSRGINVPILPGVMPIYSIKMMKMLAGICGATITEKIHRAIGTIPEDDTNAVEEFGIDFAFRQCRELLWAQVPGLHFYTMDKSKSTAAVVNKLRKEGLLPSTVHQSSMPVETL